MIISGVERPEMCPRCSTVLVLRPCASVFDPAGGKYGAMLFCNRCGWDDWGYPV